jgi:hypothetical protein
MFCKILIVLPREIMINETTVIVCPFVLFSFGHCIVCYYSESVAQ